MRYIQFVHSSEKLSDALVSAHDIHSFTNIATDRENWQKLKKLIICAAKADKTYVSLLWMWIGYYYYISLPKIMLSFGCTKHDYEDTGNQNENPSELWPSIMTRAIEKQGMDHSQVIAIEILKPNFIICIHQIKKWR